MSIQEETGKVATSAIETFRASPGLLFLTIVNIAFLTFTYFVGTLVLKAYQEDQTRVNERYTLALKTVDRCIDAGLAQLENAKRAQERIDAAHGEEGRPH
jgi:hypothetical protein